jgi:hypothetical protein
MNPYWLIVGLTVLTQFFIFLRWLHRRMRNSEIERAFVRDMARHHLPHLYHALQLIAERLGISLDEQPLVRFIDLNENDSHRDSTSFNRH